MKKLFTLGALLFVVLFSKSTQSANTIAIEPLIPILEGPWHLVDPTEMQSQSTLVLETVALFEKVQAGYKLNSHACQKTAAAWLALAQTIGPNLSYENFQRGVAGNYRRCKFTNTPPLYLCLGLKSPTQLQEHADISSSATAICEAIRQFGAKEDQEKNLTLLRATLVPLYGQLVAENNCSPFSDFGAKEDFGFTEFEKFFSSIETLEAAQAREKNQFHPLDRFGQILRQSSIFTQSRGDLRLAIAASKGQQHFDALIHEQRTLWNAAQVLPETPNEVGALLNQLSINSASGEQDDNPELAQAGLTLLQKGGKRPSFWITDKLYPILPALADLFGQQ